MQQRDDVWSRVFRVCKLGSCRTYTSHWCYRQLQSTQEAEDSIREPHPSKHRLQTTDCQHSLLPAQYLPWYIKQDLPSLPPLLQIRVYPPISLDKVWWDVIFQSITGFYLLSFSEQTERASQYGFCQWVPGHDGGSWTQDQKLMKEQKPSSSSCNDLL